jgi:hypothetical protein
LHHCIIPVSSDSRWLYEKIYTIDACFKLSMKAGGKKRSDNDPELASGFGVFVNEDHYQETLRKNANVLEVWLRLGIMR